MTRMVVHCASNILPVGEGFAVAFATEDDVHVFVRQSCEPSAAAMHHAEIRLSRVGVRTTVHSIGLSYSAPFLIATTLFGEVDPHQEGYTLSVHWRVFTFARGSLDATLMITEALPLNDCFEPPPRPLISTCFRNPTSIITAAHVESGSLHVSYVKLQDDALVLLESVKRLPLRCRRGPEVASHITAHSIVWSRVPDFTGHPLLALVFDAPNVPRDQPLTHFSWARVTPSAVTEGPWSVDVLDTACPPVPLVLHSPQDPRPLDESDLFVFLCDNKGSSASVRNALGVFGTFDFASFTKHSKPVDAFMLPSVSSSEVGASQHGHVAVILANIDIIILSLELLTAPPARSGKSTVPCMVSIRGHLFASDPLLLPSRCFLSLLLCGCVEPKRRQCLFCFSSEAGSKLFTVRLDDTDAARTSSSVALDTALESIRFEGYVDGVTTLKAAATVDRDAPTIFVSVSTSGRVTTTEWSPRGSHVKLVVDAPPRLLSNIPAAAFSTAVMPSNHNHLLVCNDGRSGFEIDAVSHELKAVDFSFLPSPCTLLGFDSMHSTIITDRGVYNFGGTGSLLFPSSAPRAPGTFSSYGAAGSIVALLSPDESLVHILTIPHRDRKLRARCSSYPPSVTSAATIACASHGSGSILIAIGGFSHAPYVALRHIAEEEEEDDTHYRDSPWIIVELSEAPPLNFSYFSVTTTTEDDELIAVAAVLGADRSSVTLVRSNKSSGKVDRCVRSLCLGSTSIGDVTLLKPARFGFLPNRCVLLVDGGFVLPSTTEERWRAAVSSVELGAGYRLDAFRDVTQHATTQVFSALTASSETSSTALLHLCARSESQTWIARFRVDVVEAEPRIARRTLPCRDPPLLNWRWAGDLRSDVTRRLIAGSPTLIVVLEPSGALHTYDVVAGSWMETTGLDLSSVAGATSFVQLEWITSFVIDSISESHFMLSAIDESTGRSIYVTIAVSWRCGRASTIVTSTIVTSFPGLPLFACRTIGDDCILLTPHGGALFKATIRFAPCELERPYLNVSLPVAPARRPLWTAHESGDPFSKISSDHGDSSAVALSLTAAFTSDTTHCDVVVSYVVDASVTVFMDVPILSNGGAPQTPISPVRLHLRDPALYLACRRHGTLNGEEEFRIALLDAFGSLSVWSVPRASREPQQIHTSHRSQFHPWQPPTAVNIKLISETKLVVACCNGNVFEVNF